MPAPTLPSLSGLNGQPNSGTRGIAAANQLETHVPQRVLFVRSDSYGDLILFSPLLKVLKTAWPDSRIGLLLKRKHADLVPLLPREIEYILTDADPHLHSISETPHLKDLRDAVLSFDPDLLVIPSYEKNWFHAIAASAAQRSKKVAVGSWSVSQDTLRLLKDDNQPEPHIDVELAVEPSSHEREKSEVLLEHLLGTKVPLPLAAVHVDPEQRNAAVASLQNHFQAPRCFVVCNPAGTANVRIKTWPDTAYASVLNHAYKRHGFGVVLVVHCSEREYAERVRANLTPDVPCYTWLGKGGDYSELAALCSQASLYIGNDTSTMHLCESVGVPVIGIFGGGFGDRFHPSLPGSVGVSMPLPCFGCQWDCHFGNAPCLKLIEPIDVCAQLDAIITRLQEKNRVASRVYLQTPSPLLSELAAQARAKFEEIRADNRARGAQIANLSQMVNSTEKRLGLTYAESTDRMRQISELSAIIQGTEKESSLLREQVEELNQIARTQRDEIVNLNQIGHRQKEEIDGLNKIARTQQDEIVDLNKIARAQQDEIVGLNKIARRQQDEIVDLNKIAHRQKEEIVGLNKIARRQQDEIVDLNKIARRQQDEIVDLNKIAHRQKEEIVGLNEIARTQQDEIVSLNQIVHRQKDEIVNLNQIVRRQKAELEKAEQTARQHQLAARSLAYVEKQRDSLEEAAFFPVDIPLNFPDPERECLLANIDEVSSHGNSVMIRGWCLLPRELKGGRSGLSLMLPRGDRYFSVRLLQEKRTDVLEAYRDHGEGRWALEPQCGFYASVAGLNIKANETISMRLMATSPDFQSPAFSRPMLVQVTELT